MKLGEERRGFRSNSSADLLRNLLFLNLSARYPMYHAHLRIAADDRFVEYL